MPKAKQARKRTRSTSAPDKAEPPASSTPSTAGERQEERRRPDTVGLSAAAAAAPSTTENGKRLTAACGSHSKGEGGEDRGASATGERKAAQLIASLYKKWASVLKSEVGLTLEGCNTPEDPNEAPKASGDSHSCGVLELWAFCTYLCRLQEQDVPQQVLEPIGLRLTGVFDLFAEQCAPDGSLATHGRHFYDLPECLPVLEVVSSPGSSSLNPAGYHMCIFRDREDQVPHAVVSNVPSEGPAFSVVCADPELLTLPESPVASGLLSEGRGNRAQKGKRAEGKAAKRGGPSVSAEGGGEPTAPVVPLLLAALWLFCERILADAAEPASTDRAGVRKRTKMARKDSERGDHAPAGHRPANPGEAAKIKEALSAWLKEELAIGADSVATIEENTQRWTTKRKKAIAASDLSGLGILVPYHAETEIGYRNLGITNAGLKKTIMTIKSAPKEQRDTQPLDELLNLAGIAMDEGDVGTALQLGRNLFLLDAPNETGCKVVKAAKLLLRSAYNLLEQPHFAEIVDATSDIRNRCVQQKS
ncbi:hypothetical protein BESB_077420 [Besnoitia besnoiti]|uniref:Uncharacterized protein n=1 Tax=Besnoitia besnoiti TaxID=94643 RepID=A0A2A9M6C5_BESBE|nr:hypothetical protein BESB_077420 [Besnoitia besnoiti]PFH33525.1 hypothetical protein BESB_077420 [Besnoitia besnoiti]